MPQRTHQRASARGAFFRHEVEQSKEAFGRCPIVAKVDFTWMNCIVPDDSDEIQRLLHFWVEALLHKRSNVGI
jgi:hypothetical protein